MRPSKKDFADLINQVTGESSMTEAKLDQILKGAQKSYRNHGMNGFYEYMRKLLQVPVSNEWMKKLMEQMKTPEGLEQLMKEMDLTLQLNKQQGGTSGNRISGSTRSKSKKGKK
ncbi:hypothetical protein ACFO25_08400 [Paenactinomyces guangxiensis]|uniref:Uncharacterized protein n=1 Tax=Paenactinomyces guangxiensis TaxID=1490290 RepID=A0A7W2A6W1_9BACL|nr:hypothetical protein [Paenactinomyces guangxiensis]MBA4492935.1 hypothetical protein [Paenactinomyces guangxiensis]MBH8590216.1 hypothetical protein [Paenactinomyces guangxiensis]